MIGEGLPILAGTIHSIICILNIPDYVEVDGVQFTWKKNGNLISENIRIVINQNEHNTTLLLNTLRTSDGGLYQCVAEVTIKDTSITVNVAKNTSINVTSECSI